MRLPDDDEIYEVDQSYLGPPGRYLGVFRYKAIGAGLIVLPMTFATLHAVGISFGWFGTVVTLIADVVAVGWVADQITYERPIKALLATVWSDLVAPRPATRTITAATREVASRSQPDKATVRWQRKKSAKTARTSHAQQSEEVAGV